MATREPGRSEATLQADIRTFLLVAPLNLAEEQLAVDPALEAQVGGGKRIDIEVGFTAIEVKKDLTVGDVFSRAVEQLGGYVRTRTEELGQRYVGVLTDGASWHAFRLRNADLLEVSSFTSSASKPEPEALAVWLEGVLATQQGISPTPREIARRLGAASAGHALNRATLLDLYEANCSNPSVQQKRQLWSELLTTALGTQFEDSTNLFVEHTLLVNMAEIIAHSVLDLDVNTLPAATLLNGRQFELARIAGVVEHDFFDWVLEVPGGEAFVRGLARQVARFEWGAVEHDVLKVLYESVIGTETRQRLGEYYTPDWLAEKMVADVIDDPLHQRVLDPSCGSGTFIFHAVTRYIRASEDAGISLQETLAGLPHRVVGLDLHPVAVALARVTYLLAISRKRLNSPERDWISVPVYLGDSVQWQQRLDLYSDEGLQVPVGDSGQIWGTSLVFPGVLLEDAQKFDQLVSELARRASERTDAGPVPSLSMVFRRLAVPESAQPSVQATFAEMCRLHDEGRDHIWGYYVRNLARPLWMSQQPNRADVLIGNPPWLAFRKMPAEMQERFKAMSQTRKMWHGAAVATNQDLSGLFVARAVQQYLKEGGRFAFVMPNAVLDRRQFEGFRAGSFPDPVEPCSVQFARPWDLRKLRPHFFPRGACVVFGRRASLQERSEMPEFAEWWSGRLDSADSWAAVEPSIDRVEAPNVVVDDAHASPYQSRFTQGATLVPRVLFVVDRADAGPLGLGANRVAVRSTRSAYEKAPWKTVPDHDGVVESEFVRPALFGEHVLPFILRPPALAVVPFTGSQLLRGSDQRIDLYPDLARWWREAEQTWATHRRSDRLDLVDQLDYRRKFSEQFPVIGERVVYAASGMHAVAARVSSTEAIIEHSLYWASVESSDEGRYLCAIINSPTITQRVRPLMSYGKDERHVDKYLWKLPIPKYSPGDDQHRRLAELSHEAELFVEGLELPEDRYFVSLRQEIRAALENSDLGREISELVDLIVALPEDP